MKMPILCASEREEMVQKIIESVHKEFEQFKEYELSLEKLTIFNINHLLLNCSNILFLFGFFCVVIRNIGYFQTHDHRNIQS